MEHFTDTAGLRTVYREPSPVVAAKSIDHLDEGVRGFLARSPLFVFATTDGDSVDASPRGGPPGFVRVLDAGHLAFGDLNGNNRLDSYSNVVAQPMVGMLFLIPGLDETLRVNGRASITTDLTVREQCEVDGRVPKVAVVVEVAEAFVHCAKAFRRSALWQPDTWPAPEERPSAAAMFNAHLNLGLDPAVIEAELEADYVATMWEPGGDNPS